jgi:ELWxxDGT repeat protein
VVAGDALYFVAWTPGSGDELWKSDGTTGGPIRVKALNPGAGSVFPAYLTSVNRKIFFITLDEFASGSQRYGLWVSDGSEGGTVRLKDFAIGPDRLPPSSLTSVGGVLSPFALNDVNGDHFFFAYKGADGLGLWKSDETADGTVRVKDINPGSGSSHPASLTAIDGRLFFTADNGTSGREQWTSDGTAQGTVRVKVIAAGAQDATPSGGANVGGALFFTSYVSNGDQSG